MVEQLNEVVEQLDIEQLPGRHDLDGQRHVGRRGGRVAGRMVVDGDEGGGLLPYRVTNVRLAPEGKAAKTTGPDGRLGAPATSFTTNSKATILPRKETGYESPIDTSMTAEPVRAEELRRRSISAGLQPITREKAGEVLSLEWGVSGIFDARVERVFKVRCIQPCRGHVGYVEVISMTPSQGTSPRMVATFAEQRASTNAWLDAQDELWREKYQITGRERLEAPIPGGGQRWVKFIPLEGWTIERGLWHLTARATEQQERGYPLSGRRPSALFKHMSEEQITNIRRFGSEIGSDFAEALRPSTMVPDFGQPVMEDRLRLFPQYAKCPTRGCHRILRIEPCWEALE